MTAAIRLAGVRAGYGGLEILHGVDLEVVPGELFALLGPNGSGKTTLLNVVAGHLGVTAGSVEVLGSVKRRAPHRIARSGLIFIGDDRQLFGNLTVEQSLKLVPRRGDEAVQAFPELEKLMSRRIGLLSGGEQQMLALGRALSLKPRLIVVDELSQGLAPIVRGRLLEILRGCADSGTAVLVVEQNVDAVLGVADRAAVLRRGEIVDTRPAAGWLERQDELAETYLS